MKNSDKIKEIDKLLNKTGGENRIVIALEKILDGLARSESKLSSLDTSEELDSVREVLLDIIVEVRKSKLEMPDILDVNVLNEKEYPEYPDSVKVSNLGELKQGFASSEMGIEKLTETIVKKLDDVSRTASESIKENISRSLGDLHAEMRKREKPIAVRLSNGKQFYNALMQVMSSGGGRYAPFKDPNGTNMAANLDSDGNLKIAVESTGTTKASFQVNDIEELSGGITYVGKESSSGLWWLMKIDESGSPSLIQHASITTDPARTSYTLAWSNRTTLSYVDYGSAF